MPGALRDQKRSLSPLELELEVVVSHLMWMLGSLRAKRRVTRICISARTFAYSRQ